MAMFAIAGIGLLVNTIQGLQQQSQMRQMQAEGQNQFQQMQSQFGGTTQQTTTTKGPQTKSIFNFEAPPYPEENFSNLQEMQTSQAEKRNSYGSQLGSDLQDMKNEFFAENHYDTENAADGKARVSVNDQGQPKPVPGAETNDQKLARKEFEATEKAQLADKHAEQKESFLKDERQSMKEFLAQNKDNLDNPAVHAELQKMVVSSKKKALQLQQSQEEERMKVDMPPDQKIALKMQEGMNGLHQMDQDHIRAEEESPDAQAIMEHDQKVAAILGERKEQARQEKKDEEFLVDPRKMLAAKQNAGNAPVDPGDHVPAYLAAHLYDLGIYSV